MDIGTAKLPVAERRGVPHHQLDVLDVTEEASVAAYQRRRAGRHRRHPRPRPRARARRRVGALRAGGPRPARDPADRPGGARRASRREAEVGGGAALHARLRALDPRRGAVDPAGQRPSHRPGAGGHRADRPAVQRDDARPASTSRPTVQLGLRLDRDARSTSGSTARVERMWEDGLRRRGRAPARRAACATVAPRRGPSATPRSWPPLDGELDEAAGAASRPRRRPVGSPGARSRGSAATRGSIWLDAADARPARPGADGGSRGGCAGRDTAWRTWLT